MSATCRLNFCEGISPIEQDQLAQHAGVNGRSDGWHACKAQAAHWLPHM